MHSAPAGGYKSAFAAQIEHHIAYGTEIPGLDWQFAQHGDCLVISPDETAYEMQDRTFRILPGGQLETDGRTGLDSLLPDIHVRHDPKGNTFDLKIAWLLAEIETIERATGRHVVWVRWDTMGNLLGDRGTTDAYSASMPLQRLNQIMANNHRTMFVPNHVGKDGKHIGTVGLVSSSNIATKATITKASNSGVITCLDDDTKMRGGRGWSAAVVLRDGLLELTDESPAEAAHQLGSMPRTVAAYLAKHGPTTVAELRTGTGIPDKPLWKCILRLKAKDEVVNDSGRWILQETGSVAQWSPSYVTCEQCPCIVDPERGCVNLTCPAYVPANWPQVALAGIPGQRTPDPAESRPAVEAVAAVTASAPLETEPELDPEIAGNPAMDRLIECVRESRLYAERKLPDEIRGQLGYERVGLGGRPNAYQMFPAEAPPALRRVLILDRRAAYYQSCVAWTAPNRLHREGGLDYGDVLRRGLAGMFEVLYTPYDVDRAAGYPDPFGDLQLSTGARLLVPRSTLDRVMDSVKAGYRTEPEIMYGLCGKGTERGPMYHWGKACLDARRGVAGPERDRLKEQQNQAFGTLRISDPDKNPGPVDRPDWQYAVIGHHYAQVSRYVWRSLDKGEPVIGAGNTDEIIYLIPEDAHAELVDGRYDGWIPKTMQALVSDNRFSVKAVRDAAEWFKNPRALSE